MVSFYGRQIVLSRPSSQVVKGFDARCTHAQCPVEPASRTLECPCHGSVFDTFSGAVIQGPAKVALSTVPVHIEGDGVVID